MKIDIKAFRRAVLNDLGIYHDKDDMFPYPCKTPDCTTRLVIEGYCTSCIIRAHVENPGPIMKFKSVCWEDKDGNRHYISPPKEEMH